jgi:ribosome-binding protein aMBF1 (putative translation factor)
MSTKNVVQKNSLRQLSDDELLVSLKSLIAREKEILLEILNHLKELDSRRLYLELGYPSLWAYCTTELKYSEAAAQRRIEAMRALREMPMLESKIISGALTLTNIAKVQSTVRRAKAAGHVAARIDSDFSTADLKTELFTKLENKTGREADLMLAETFPEAITYQQKIRPINAEHLALQLTVNKKLLAKLEQVKSLYSHQKTNESLAETIEFIADLAIKNKLLQRFGREAVAEKIVAQAKVSEATNASNSIAANIVSAPVQLKVESKAQPPLRRLASAAPSTPQTKLTSRSLTKSLRHQVWQKAGAACEFTYPTTGLRCSGRHKLEIEHIKPLALGGTHNEKNLKLYCQAHNQLAARYATLR